MGWDVSVLLLMNIYYTAAIKLRRVCSIFRIISSAEEVETDGRSYKKLSDPCTHDASMS